MEELLMQIVDELRSLNAKMDLVVDALPVSRPLHDLDDIHKAIADLSEDLTGPLGYNLGDVHSKLDEVISAI